jgi:hypothetical protein
MKYKMLNSLIPKIESKSESFAHKVIKQLFYKKVLESNSNIIEASLEKYFGSRRADVYFKFASGEEVVIEIQNSPITSKEITARTKDYNSRGIYVLWVLYGGGRCVGSPKDPKNSKNLKISPAEMRLHQLYGGRVYYVSIKYKKDKITTTLPFSMHFSYSDTIAPTLFRKRFISFFYRNVNYTFIPNWNILCAEYNKYKIARFYDKSIQTTLTKTLKDFARRNNAYKNLSLDKRKKTRRFFKLILSVLKDEFGELFIIHALLRLVAKRELILNKKYLKQKEIRLKRKVKTKINKIKL